MKKVLVKSELGLLGDLEGKECYLHEQDYDLYNMTTFGIVSLIPEGKRHRVAMEHLKEITGATTDCAPNMSDFEIKVNGILNEIKELLVAKNEKYGNSALEPIRVFSKASASEQILVRLDDKLSRLRTQHITEDEDIRISTITNSFTLSKY